MSPTADEISSILSSGNFDRLLGVTEGTGLDFKAVPYRIAEDREKMELAKDVSSFANSRGGRIILGVETEKEPDRSTDIARRIRPFPPNFFEITRYQNIVADWIYPPLPDVTFEWHASATDPTKGLASITIPPKSTLNQPHIVTKVVQSDGRSTGAYVGFFERVREDSLPMSAQQLRDRFKDGLRFMELSARLEAIEAFIESQKVPSTKPAPGITADELAQRVVRARRIGGLEGKPTLFLTAVAQQELEFPTLFQSRGADPVRLLNNPPQFRESGFDLNTGKEAEIVEGRLRRAVASQRKLLELSRDGALIFIAAGDEWYLGWGMKSGADTGIRINNIALTETALCFVDLAFEIFRFAQPVPVTLSLQLGLLMMTRNGKPCTLSRAYPTSFNVGDFSKAAPGPQHVVDYSAAMNDADIFAIAYQLLARLYAWFGFEENEIPYVDRKGIAARIDPQIIAQRAG